MSSPADGNEPDSAGPISKAFNVTTLSLARIGTIVIFAVMLLVNADVVGRYFFNSPIAGVPELVSLSIVMIVYLQLAHTLRLERFIRSDVFIGRLLTLRPRIGFALQAVHHLVGAILTGLIFWFMVPQFIDSYRDGDYVGSLGVFQAPKWPVEMIVMVGAGLCAIQFILHVIRDVSVVAGRIPAPVPQEHESL